MVLSLLSNCVAKHVQPSIKVYVLALSLVLQHSLRPNFFHHARQTPYAPFSSIASSAALTLMTRAVTVKDAFGPKRPPVNAPPTARPKAKTDPSVEPRSTQTASQSQYSQLPIGKTAQVAPALLLPRPPSLYKPAALKREDDVKAAK